MKRKIIVFTSLLTLFIGCESNKKKDFDAAAIKIEGVELNALKPWKANSATTEGIKIMQANIATFSDENNIEAYGFLKSDLEDAFTTIFQKCTMKGEAHNQLHNYLKPMLPILDGFESKELDSCKFYCAKMERHLAGYANYFE